MNYPTFTGVKKKTGMEKNTLFLTLTKRAVDLLWRIGQRHKGPGFESRRGHGCLCSSKDCVNQEFNQPSPTNN